MIYYGQVVVALKKDNQLWFITKCGQNLTCHRQLTRPTKFIPISSRQNENDTDDKFKMIATHFGE